jgi:hypothetical protein
VADEQTDEADEQAGGDDDSLPGRHEDDEDDVPADDESEAAAAGVLHPAADRGTRRGVNVPKTAFQLWRRAMDGEMCFRKLECRDPSDRATWDGTGSGAEALYGQYVRVPEGVALPAHLRDCPGCCVQLQAGDDIVGACQPTFAADIRAHATRLGLSDEDRERIVALNMAACIAVCGFFSMAAGDRVRITRMECYGGDLEESASTTPTARA